MVGVSILKLQGASRIKGSRKAKKQANVILCGPLLLTRWGTLYGLSLSPSGSLENQLLYIYLLSES